MTVTDSARMSVPKGSPTRSATTSAWWTATSTAPKRERALTAARLGTTSTKLVNTNSARAAAGANQVQRGMSDTPPVSEAGTGYHRGLTHRTCRHGHHLKGAVPW